MLALVLSRSDCSKDRRSVRAWGSQQRAGQARHKASCSPRDVGCSSLVRKSVAPRGKHQYQQRGEAAMVMKQGMRFDGSARMVLSALFPDDGTSIPQSSECG